MEKHPPRQPSSPHAGSPVARRRSQAFQRTRAAAVAVCAVSLAVALGLGVHSAAQARSTAAVQLGGQATDSQSVAPAAIFPVATASAGAIDVGGELHDAGILAKDGRAYALVIYTKGEDLSSIPERTEVIHQVTAAVTDALF